MRVHFVRARRIKGLDALLGALLGQLELLSKFNAALLVELDAEAHAAGNARPGGAVS